MTQSYQHAAKPEMTHLLPKATKREAIGAMNITIPKSIDKRVQTWYSRKEGLRINAVVEVGFGGGVVTSFIISSFSSIDLDAVRGANSRTLWWFVCVWGGGWGGNGEVWILLYWKSRHSIKITHINEPTFTWLHLFRFAYDTFLASTQAFMYGRCKMCVGKNHFHDMNRSSIRVVHVLLTKESCKSLATFPASTWSAEKYNPNPKSPTIHFSINCVRKTHA